MSDFVRQGEERSRATLADHPAGDITNLIWPTYRRVTAAAGGDVTASFSFSNDDNTLETWFYEYLAREFRETYTGKSCFLGRIHTMRLAYNRLVMTVSLDWLFNRVACQYTSVLDNSTLITDFFEDTASVAIYGSREHIIRPTDSIGLSEAEDLAARFLEDFSFPRISRGKIEQPLKRGALQATVQGMGQTLDAQFYNYEIEGTDDASVEVATTLSGASLVIPGNISANTVQVAIDSDYRRRLKRIEWIATQRDASNRRYNFGTFGSNRFDYQPVEGPASGGLRYNVRVKGTAVRYFSGANYVPAPLVQPGGWSRIVDMRPSGIADPERDPLYQFDAVATYDKNGCSLQGDAWSERDRAEAIQIQIVNRR